MPPKIVITGWSRGGLGYIYQLLQKADQDVGLTFSDVVTEQDFESRLDSARSIEVSSGLVPFMMHPALKDTKFYFALRDPMRVLNSLTFLGWFRADKQTYPKRLAIHHLKRGRRYVGYPVLFTCYYLLGWLRRYKNNCKALGVIPDALHVEVGHRTILRQLGLSASEDLFIPRHINASLCKQTLVPSRLKPQARKIMKIVLRASRYKHLLWLPRGGHAHYINPDWHT